MWVSSQRLIGTPLGPGHLDALAPLLADGRVAAIMGGPLDRAATLAHLERSEAHWRRHGFGWWAWTDRATGRFVARGGLEHTLLGGRAEVEVGWLVDPERWGEGLATELGALSLAYAGQQLALARVVAIALPGNAASRRVMEKLGMAYECDVVHAGSPHVLLVTDPRG